MTEAIYWLDPDAYRADEDDHMERLRAAAPPVRQRLLELRTAEQEAVEQERMETVKRNATEGLAWVAGVIGTEALKKTADLVGVELSKIVPKTPSQ